MDFMEFLKPAFFIGMCVAGLSFVAGMAMLVELGSPRDGRLVTFTALSAFIVLALAPLAFYDSSRASGACVCRYGQLDFIPQDTDTQTD